MAQVQDKQGTPLELVLYKFDTCPFCVRVMTTIESLGIPLQMRDTIQDRGAREELMRIGGKTQVPCLLINGEPLYESADIIRYLRDEVQVA